MKSVQPKKITLVEPVDTEQPKTEQEKAQDFIRAYERLCNQHGFQIIVSPAFKAMADTGTFNVVLQTSVGKLPKNDQQTL